MTINSLLCNNYSFTGFPPIRSRSGRTPHGNDSDAAIDKSAYPAIMAGWMAQQRKIYSVGQVNMLVKVALEEILPPRLIVRGQISGFKRHSKGHCYFSLKEEATVLPCVMWASKHKSVKFDVEDGMAVLATGNIDVFLAGGKYQLYVDKLEPEGVGALQLAFEQMVAKLKAEGLFDDVHKKPLPAYPMRIGIMTSETGAAVHDITDSISNRWPCARMFLYPVPVQGEGAAAKIAKGLRDINRRNKKLKLDVLIVGRGGGSLEDLWAFNEEPVARAIFESKIPVISAVGHEVDTTIADLVADARASTPTKAGVVAVPDVRDVLGDLANKQRIMRRDITANLELARTQLETILASRVFRDPRSIVYHAEEQVDEMSMRMAEAMRGILAHANGLLTRFYEQVVRIEPHRLMGNRLLELNQLESRVGVGMQRMLNGWQVGLTADVTRLQSAMKAVVNRSNVCLTAVSNRLEALNPRSVLHRGYSITMNKRSGRVVRALADVAVGDMLVTELAGDERIESEIKEMIGPN